ncbi:hypothetical protein D9M70_598460 [compost metagenome]
MDQHHRRTHPHAGDFRLEGALVFAVEMRNVRGCAAHVETDDPVEAGRFTGLGETDDAAGRAGEDSILALEHIGGREPARRHHEHDPGTGARDIELARHLRHVAAQYRREIGVDDGGIAATDIFDQR